MKVEIDIIFSSQAKDMLQVMPSVKKEDVVDWFINDRKISIGGGDIISYIQTKKLKGIKNGKTK